MMLAKYTKLNSEESLSFDYSSAFSYDAISKKYSSPFSYNVRQMDCPDVTMERGLKSKSTSAVILYYTAVAICTALILLTFPVSIWFVIKRVSQDEQVILSRLGFIKCIKGPSMMFFVPCIDQLQRYATTLRAFNVPPQKMTTSDGLVVELGAVVRYQIVDAEKTCFAAQNIDHTLRVTAQTITSKYMLKVEEKQLTDNSSIAAVNSNIRHELQQAYHQWGVAVQSYEMVGLKAILRIQQPDAISNVIEPIKQWLFSGQHDGQSPLGQIANMFSATAGQQFQATSPNPQPFIAEQTNDLKSLRHKLTASDLLTAVKTICNHQLVAQINSVFKFIIPDDNPGVYFMDLKNGNGDCGAGEPPVTPDAVITVSLTNMQLMFTGDLRPFDAYMSGDLKISGDLSSAMKLDKLVDSIMALSNTPMSALSA